MVWRRFRFGEGIYLSALGIYWESCGSETLRIDARWVGDQNCFITVAERDLLLPRSLTKRLVNHARPGDVTEGYAADWTVEQLRAHAQRIADRIDELMCAEPEGAIELDAPVGEPGGP